MNKKKIKMDEDEAPDSNQPQPREYQIDLLEKAKRENIIVYLGTGSGKTFIAVMLIKHMRGELGRLDEDGKFVNGKKVVFLSPSVALVDQQAEAIHNCTGLAVGKYTGADGVDDWTEDIWQTELNTNQVLVFVHDVFKLILMSRYISYNNICLLILDECHHAVKDHPYSVIMDTYHRCKSLGEPVPKILGLTACVVVKTCDVGKFREEKSKLEAKTDARVVTTDDQNLQYLLEHVTAPLEDTVLFSNDQGLPEMTEINKLIDAATNDLGEANCTEKERIRTTMNSITNAEVAKKDLEKDFKKLKNDVLFMLQDSIYSIGLYSAMEQIAALLKDVSSSKRRMSNIYYDETTREFLFDRTTACLEEIRSILNKLNSEKSDSELKDQIRVFSSPKFIQLQDRLLKEKDHYLNEAMKNDPTGGKVVGDGFDHISCIIFVERKSVAVSMAKMFKILSMEDHRFAGVKVDYVHSPEGGFFNTKTQRYVFSPESIAERKRIQEVLTKFKRRELNLLISTSVVEEGLDVRSCNLVIKYDFPATFRSYVQSKGRARKKPSKYLMFINAKDMKKLGNFRKVEEISLRECHYQPDQSEVLEDELDLYFTDPENPHTSAFINGSQAISLIHRYISKIPVDRFTRLTAVWRVTEVAESSPQNLLFRGLGQHKDKEFICTCYMPHKSPFREKIVGPEKSSKEGAKRACALLIVKMLYEFGELTHRLKIKNPEAAEQDDDFEEEFERGRKIGTTRRRQFYRQEDPWPLNVAPSHDSAYLYKVEMVLVVPHDRARYQHYHPEHDSVSLGLVLGTRQGPEYGPIKIYGPSGQLEVAVRFMKEVKCDEDFLQKAKHFHEFAFTKVLSISDVEFSVPSVLLVPLVHDKIDFSVISDRSHLPITRDSVVQPKYNCGMGRYFFVEDVVDSVTPKTKMNDSPLTYVQHFKQRLNIDILDVEQPLLRISNADKKKFMLKPGDESVKDKNSDDLSKRRLLVPELMNQMPLSSGLWRQIQVIPFVIERMRSLLFSTNLSQKLSGVRMSRETPLQLKYDDVFNFSERAERDRFDLAGLLKFDPGRKLVNLDLMEALTLKNCNDLFDLENLEVIGDVFLKYSVGIYVFYALIQCQDNYKKEEMEDDDDDEEKIIDRNIAEGELTALRSKIVGNKNLYRIAVDNLDLHKGCLNSVKINTHTTWRPPGAKSTREQLLMELDEKLPELIEDDKKRRSLSVGYILNLLNIQDLDKDPQEILSIAKERLMSRDETCETETVVHGISTREHRIIGDKSLSDCVEALIGAFLVNTGQKNTLTVMAGMGLNVLDPGRDKQSLETSLNNLYNRKTEQVNNPKLFTPLKDAFVNYRKKGKMEEHLNQLYRELGVEEIEDKINYKFKEKSFLLQAFTHSSYGDNILTNSYECLEFLGDSVLDYLVTIYIYSKKKNITPGELTEIRSALVCNNMFAGLLVDKKLHGNILYSAPAIRAKITDYVEYRNIAERLHNRETASDLTKAQASVNKEGLKLINETEPPSLAEVEVPKVLGDVFEALIGAVYIDSGHNLEEVWRVYLCFQPGLDAIICDPPKNPKKLLHEKCQKVDFGKVDVKDDHVRIQVTVKVKNESYRFVGMGNNKRQAEVAAAKCALRSLGMRDY